MSRWGFYVLFTVSGFAGLIYESIWTHYLKLFLGHAAYAQSLVLVVFMGGMAAGAAWCARLSRRLANPLLRRPVVLGRRFAHRHLHETDDEALAGGGHFVVSPFARGPSLGRGTSQYVLPG